MTPPPPAHAPIDASHRWYVTPASASRRFHWLAAAVLAVIILIAHGGSLSDGLFFDDHWHRVTLRNADFTFQDLTEAATFDLPGRLATLWWQTEPLQWRYSRSVAMLFMKLELLLSGGDPRWIHAFALGWHWIACLLVYRIGLWALPHRGWALLAGIMFALDPQSVFALGWTAARNAVVSGVFFAAALHVYALASFVRRAPIDSYCTRRAFTALLLWLVALFSRETAVVFPLLLPLLDLSVGGWALVRRRIPVYGLAATIMCAYLYWRLWIFPTGAPPDIYFTVPRGPEYLLWAGTKMLHMLFAHVIHTPMFLGLSTYTGIDRGAMVEYAIVGAILAVVTAAYLVGARGIRTRWFWLALLILGFAPVIPVFVMPHFAYLPAIATAIGIPAMLHRLVGRWRSAGVAFVVAAAAFPLAVYRYVWRGIVRSEQLVYQDIRSSTPEHALPDFPAGGESDVGGNPPAVESPSGAGEPPKLFFINLPICGIYGAVAMRESWGRDDVEGYVLTFAANPLMMQQTSRVTQTGPRELTVEIDGPGYFSGLSGRMLVDGMRDGRRFVGGERITSAEFDVEIVALAGDGAGGSADGGVSVLRFTFPRPLDSPDYFFYVSSPERPARRLRFGSAAPTPEAAAAADAAWQSEHAEMLAERENYFTILDTVRRFIRSNLYLTGD